MTEISELELQNLRHCKCQYKNVHKVANKNVQLST